MRTDTRNLIVDTQGIYLRPTAIKRGDAICDFCSVSAACALQKVVERCGQFVPALNFVSAVGLEGSFSTFRASAIWYDRVMSLQEARVGLIDLAGEVIGTAKIVSAHRAGFAQLMADHAKTNHLTKHHGVPEEEAPAFLTRWIRNNMGSMYVKEPEAIGTVIELIRE